MKQYSIPQYKMVITIEDNGAGEITSELKKELIDENEPNTFNEIELGEAQADVLESFILALACEGYEVSEPRFVKALASSLEAIANNS